MNPRRRDSSILTSPVLIGALTVLVVVVAVALAYNANTGLPFVPTYNLHVQTDNASELQKGDNVNLGGALVGIVKSVSPSRTRAGRPIAVLNLSLYKSVEPLPRDTTFTVRLKGAIGLKYLAVNLGHDRRSFANGATVPVSHSGTAVDFDQVLSMFDAPTRRGVAQSTIGLGQALAGRGYDINQAIGAFGPLLTNLQPVAANLASRRTDLAGFFRGLDSFSGALTPVAETQAMLFANLDTTFRAFASAAPSLADTISATPPAFEATLRYGPTIRPFLTDFGSLLRQLRPGVVAAGASAPELADTFRIGARTLPPTASLDRQLVSVSRRLERFSDDPTAQAGLDRVTLTARSLREPLAFLAPVQTTCNYVTLFLRNTSDLVSAPAGTGTFLQFVPIGITDLPGRESQPSHKLYTGPIVKSSGPTHSNPYPYTASPGQPRACSAGNEPFLHRSVIGNPPGKLSATTQKTERELK